jgi:hypothetical protein
MNKNINILIFFLSFYFFSFMGLSLIVGGGCKGGTLPSAPLPTPLPTPNTGGYVPNPISLEANHLWLVANIDYVQATPGPAMLFPLAQDNSNDIATNFSYAINVSDSHATVSPSSSLSGVGPQQLSVVLFSVQNTDAGVTITVQGSASGSNIGPVSGVPYLWFSITGSNENCSGSTEYLSASKAAYPSSEWCSLTDDGYFNFVALPYDGNYGKNVVVQRGANIITAPIWDCGPHYCGSLGPPSSNPPPPAPTPYSVQGDNYWNFGTRPLAETDGISNNPSGIDLSCGVTQTLGLPGGGFLGPVMWRFAATNVSNVDVNVCGTTTAPTPTPTCDICDFSGSCYCDCDPSTACYDFTDTLCPASPPYQDPTNPNCP